MRNSRRNPIKIVLATLSLYAAVAGFTSTSRASAEEVLPQHITPETLKAVRAGLDYLARAQGSDGAWHDTKGAQAYPVSMTSLAGMALLAGGNTPTRGRYAPQVKSMLDYLLRCAEPSGLITGPGQESGRPMYGHGFALLFLASSYGTVAKESVRTRMKTVIDDAIELTASGQSPYGGWTYVPGAGDEGSVTVTQVQALRAAHNAGFTVPKATIEESVRYIERCGTPEGGISYSLRSGGSARPAISCGAIAALYNAGEYDAPIAERCLEFVWNHFKGKQGWSKGGHDFYSHLYASQAFYMAGDEYWDEYFPAVRDDLLKMQNKDDGAWTEGAYGATYGTSIALIILQLPYKFLPVYQR